MQAVPVAEQCVPVWITAQPAALPAAILFRFENAFKPPSVRKQHNGIAVRIKVPERKCPLLAYAAIINENTLSPISVVLPLAAVNHFAVCAIQRSDPAANAVPPFAFVTSSVLKVFCSAAVRQIVFILFADICLYNLRKAIEFAFKHIPPFRIHLPITRLSTRAVR